MKNYIVLLSILILGCNEPIKERSRINNLTSKVSQKPDLMEMDTVLVDIKTIKSKCKKVDTLTFCRYDINDEIIISDEMFAETFGEIKFKDYKQTRYDTNGEEQNYGTNLLKEQAERFIDTNQYRYCYHEYIELEDLLLFTIGILHGSPFFVLFTVDMRNGRIIDAVTDYGFNESCGYQIFNWLEEDEFLVSIIDNIELLGFRESDKSKGEDISRDYVRVLITIKYKISPNGILTRKVLKDTSFSIEEIEYQYYKDGLITNPEGQTIEDRFNPPIGYKRNAISDNSFQQYLRRLPLKPINSKVTYFDGRLKNNNGVYEAVVDLEIGKKDLHQCADAIIRLRAEYLWNKKEYDSIHFNFTNGFRVDYKEWMNGKRINVNGNSTSWTQREDASNSYESFWRYLETIFTYSGTLSLSNELISINTNDLQIGDIFIQGGSPGHAIIVVDKAINYYTGEIIFLLAQSFMPAQEIQILINPNNKSISPWYSYDFGDKLQTPEWTFNRNDLKRFEN